MPIRVPTQLATVLVAVKNKLISDELFSAGTVYLCLDPEQLELPPDSQYCLLTPGVQTVRQEMVAGGGNDLMWFDGDFTLTLWQRLALDEYTRADQYLTDATFGLLTLMASVMRSLQLYDPVDNSLNGILAEPMRLLLQERPAMGRNVSPGWGSLASRWQISYTQSLS